MASSTDSSDSRKNSEQADLAEMLRLNQEIDERLARKRVLAARIAARYNPATALTENQSATSAPMFEEVEQQYAFDYLSAVGGRSKSQPMAAYVVSKGGDLGTSAKPGSALAPKLRKRPDVFGRDGEEWLLQHPSMWGQEQKKTGAS